MSITLLYSLSIPSKSCINRNAVSKRTSSMFETAPTIIDGNVMYLV